MVPVPPVAVAVILVVPLHPKITLPAVTVRSEGTVMVKLRVTSQLALFCSVRILTVCAPPFKLVHLKGLPVVATNAPPSLLT